MYKYLLITPVKNEEKNLPKVFNSIIHSTIKPSLWIIIDDNSEDNSKEIIIDTAKKFPELNIVYVRYPKIVKEYDLLFHYSEVCRYGFKVAINIAKKRKIKWDFLVLLDADTLLPPNYLLNIFESMKRDNVCIASGNVCDITGGKIVCHSWNPLPAGTGRVWTRRGFYFTGGYTVTVAPDTISSIRAIKIGCSCKRYSQFRLYHLRPASSKLGSIRGYFINGRRDAYLRKPLLLTFLNFLLILVSSYNIFYSFSYLSGYLYQLFIKKETSKFKYLETYWKNRLRAIRNIFIR